MRRPAPGFTMIELALALVVLAILAALALPDLGRRMERQRLQGAAQGLAADLAEARFEAARQGQALFVEARPAASRDSGWCWAVARSAGCDCAAAEACQVHAVRSADWRGVRLVEGLAVALQPGGTTAGAQQAALLESSRGEQLRVEVSALGRARVCATRGSWPNVPVCS
ncbi:MAG: GspH/FimT family protein [Rubrivivax sp.]|nr:GspH/FimT family protein [Rubrivivax sp.]